MDQSAFEAYGREMDPAFEYQPHGAAQDPQSGVFDVYSSDMLRCRKSGVLDRAAGRLWPRTDHRRLPPRRAVMASAIWFANVSCSLPTCSTALERGEALEAALRLREELAEQRRALQQMQEMAARMAAISPTPARTAREAVQWLYFAYLAAVKSQNGGAMSLGRTATFLDIYIERDLRAGRLNEQQAQELIDHFIMKIRMVRFLRTPEFDTLFSGIPSGRRRCWADGAGWPHLGQ